MKICKKCGRLLPERDYQTGKNICRYCRRGTDLQRRYGINNEQYLELWKKQGGKCGICGIKFDNEYLAVDHDHKTYEIRGLLCKSCNLLLENLIEKNITDKKIKEYLDNGRF